MSRFVLPATRSTYIIGKHFTITVSKQCKTNMRSIISFFVVLTSVCGSMSQVWNGQLYLILKFFAVCDLLMLVSIHFSGAMKIQIF